MFRALLLVALVGLVLASGVEGKKAWRAHRDLHLTHARYMENWHAENPDAPMPQFQNFTQKLNHFDEQDQRTWSQRYIVNNQYWNGNGPIFLQLSGEGPMDAGAVLGYQYVVWAQQFNALVVCLEHRFYGGSQPTADISTENLKFLSAEQALADAANFIPFFKKQYKAVNNMVITFGGSYAGMLSGWMRQKYPNLVDASVASSGPVHAEVDFMQYLEVVAASLGTDGSAQCVQNVAAANQKVEALTTSAEGLTTLAQMFQTCAPIAQEDISVLAQSIAGNFMGVVQYNLEIPGMNITTVCDIMTNGSDPLTSYLSLWREFYGDSCADVSYADMIEELKNDSINTGVAGRQWFYQTCIEFGYYQTSDSPNQPWHAGNLFNVSTQTQQCTDVFGFNFLPDVNWTRAEFGDRDPDGSNTIWVNGSIDPWHSLGVLVAPPNAPFKALLINGTAHCGDMMVPFSGSPSSLKPAQAIIQAQLQAWITAYSSK